MSLIKDLAWRYATKNMSGKAVSKKKLESILSAINLSASSYGLQPYTVLVVSRKSVKAKLQAAAYNQPQVGSSSHVLVFAVKTAITPSDVDTFISLVATTRGIPESVLAGYKAQIMGTIGAAPAEQQQIWAAKQAYIALGTGLAAAAEQKVDACPMEGFNAAEFDKILGLTKMGLKSVTIMPIGYRHADDAVAGMAKVRKASEDMFHFVK
jgi:nitroreductase / dihydropteridine reductase